MANINIQVSEFQCETPIVGTTYRNVSTTGNYIFNWSTMADLYQSYGLNTEVSLWYSTNGGTYVKYNSSTVPNNAVNFQVSNNDIGSGDFANFRLILQVDNGLTCEKTVEIFYNTIIIN